MTTNLRAADWVVIAGGKPSRGASLHGTVRIATTLLKQSRNHLPELWPNPSRISAAAATMLKSSRFSDAAYVAHCAVAYQRLIALPRRQRDEVIRILRQEARDDEMPS